MNSIKLSKLFVLITLFISVLYGQEIVENRPLEPTITLPEITLKESQLKQWTGEKPMWNSVRAWHYNPDMVQPLWDVWEALAKPPLSLRTKVMVAAVTDSRNHCPYCLSSAVCFLLEEGLSEEDILALQLDIENSTFSEKDKTLLLLAEEITVNPSLAHIQVGKALEAGWTEAEVAQAIFVVSYFNMLNRISEAFAFPPDEDHSFDPAPTFPMLTCEGFHSGWTDPEK